eukprot:CAMPEP_0198146632 /NCGR_PEP_ID=MMETSP1443-20131203/30484_1 /TAXON_ID=186043 /ORGANISM="Entomoneis sp., Strain CCMP2396" /LENGTH=221 /DNA_ID=CAMNT_0043810663 /DNA_START=180 /DNA_END=845 /DNA_ORIENTATION=-
MAPVSTSDRLAFQTLRSTCLFAQADGEGEGEEQPNGEESSSAATDILNSPAFLKRKLEVLQSDIAKVEADTEEARSQLEAGKAEWGPQLDALQTEYENIQQRFNSQSNKGDSMAIVQVSREMLKVLDNYDRAFGVVESSSDAEAEIEAKYRATWDVIMKALTDLGVEEVNTVGIEFDYEIHQAVMQKPSDEYEEGIVCEELQKGFKLEDTLIRAAMVVVAA